MAFYGSYFSFDGIPCTEFGLMIYDFDGKSDTENVLSADIEIVEDRIARRFTPLHYGVIANEPLEFTMTFGADMNSVDKGVHFDRWDLDAVSKWLTSHNKYKWLEISQPDMEAFRYKCFITDLQYTEVGNLPWGFTCTVICDSPFAYLYPKTFSYTVNGETKFDILNESSYRGYYKPKLTLKLDKGGNFSLINTSDNNRTMQFTGLPTSALQTITIDNENEIITCETIDNPYQYFNFNFLRLCKGNNHFIAKGLGAIEIVCEFPVNIGG